ncbi:MAG: hypothetical protein ACREEN_11120, partial [Stellaceae bacterium]
MASEQAVRHARNFYRSTRDHGFRDRPFGPPRNDEIGYAALAECCADAFAVFSRASLARISDS